MIPIYFFIFAITVGVNAETYIFDVNNMPIKRVVSSFGIHNLKRVDYLYAEIHPCHLTNDRRISFPRTDEFETWYQRIRASGDERSYLVPPQFSGPPEWYNFSPQNVRVNRHLEAQTFTTDFFAAECQVREFLEKGGNRYVSWTLNMTYVTVSNRPDSYRLQVKFFNNGVETDPPIDIHNRNPFKSEDSNFWLCPSCKSDKTDVELRGQELVREVCFRS